MKGHLLLQLLLLKVPQISAKMSHCCIYWTAS